MKIIVQKFGGTSVASEEARIAVKDKVQQAIRNGFVPVVVVSAWVVRVLLMPPIP